MGLFTAALDLAKSIGVFTALGGAALAFANYTGVRPVVVKEFQLVQEQMGDTLKIIQGQVQELSRSQLYNRFFWLQEKHKRWEEDQKRDKLSFDEFQEMCRIVHVLEFKGISECGT